MTRTVAKKTTEQTPVETPLADRPRALSPRPGHSLGLPSLRRMRQELDDLWNKFFVDVPAEWMAERADDRWSFDVEDRPDAYVVTAEVPGFEAQDFSIDLRGQQLVMKAKHDVRTKDDKASTFSTSEFLHSMTLPPHVMTDAITAEYKQGVLQVQLPKTDEGKGRSIPVKG